MQHSKVKVAMVQIRDLLGLATRIGSDLVMVLLWDVVQVIDTGLPTHRLISNGSIFNASIEPLNGSPFVSTSTKQSCDLFFCHWLGPFVRWDSNRFLD